MPDRVVPGHDPLARPTARGGSASALAINDQGNVAGYGGYPSGLSINRATLWRNGVPLDLGTLGGANSQAFGVNNRGQVVGSSETSTSGQAFLWQRGTMTGLGTLAGGSSGATDINNRGQVVGQRPRPRATSMR